MLAKARLDAAGAGLFAEFKVVFKARLVELKAAQGGATAAGTAATMLRVMFGLLSQPTLGDLSASFGVFVEKDRRLREEWQRIIAPTDAGPLSAALDVASAGQACGPPQREVPSKRQKLAYEL